MSSIKLLGETSGEVILKAPAIAGASEVTLPTGTVDLSTYVTAGGSVTFTTLNATTVDLGNWTITESGGVLFFATGGTNKMKLDASGNLTCVGDVTAFGTV